MDSGGLSSTATMLIYVNGAPSFINNPFTEPTVNVGQTYSGSISGTASDPNAGDTLTFTKVSGPGWLIIAADGGVSGVATKSDVGTNSFVVSVTDGGGLSGAATMLIKVNGSPSFGSNPFSEPAANAGQPYSASIAAQGTDPNPGDTLTFSKIGGPAWLSVASNGAVSGTPTDVDAGTNSFVVSVTDSGGLSNSATLLIMVNVAPSFTSDPLTAPTANAGQPYSTSIATKAYSPNTSATLTFAKLSGPAWLNVASNGALSGTPSDADVSTN